MMKEKLKELFINYPVKDIRFEYKTVIIVLNGGHEIEIGAEFDGYDEANLTIEHYVIERKRVEGIELD
jgi:hypothetical protein